MRTLTKVGSAAALATAAMLSLAGRAADGGVIQHSGTAAPATEDAYLTEGGNQFWVVNDENGPPASPEGPVDGIAWQIQGLGGGGSGYSYSAAATLADAAAGDANGWSLSTRLRLPTVSDSAAFGVLVGYADGNSLWYMRFGTQEDGDPFVQLFDSGTPPQFVLEGAGNTGYHDYQLLFDPVSNTVDLFVDGTEQISNFGGFGFTIAPFVVFGDGGDDAGIGNYALVHWSTPPIPEPAALAGFGVGALLLLRRRRA